MKKYKIIALVVLLASAFCSCEKVKIVQDVTPASVCDKTVYVSTRIRTFKWYGFANTLEYWSKSA